MNRKSIIIFTDGAARGNPGPGGFGAIIIIGDKVTELGGREAHTTNNRMELMGAIAALEYLSGKEVKDITLYADSTYVVLGMTEWAARWQRNGWKTANKKRVENQDLWERLLSAADGKKIQWKRIDGHKGVAGNERCDEIATAFADLSTSSRQAAPKLYSGVLKNYRIRNILNVS
ncbi:MAG: ribonuclease HI [Parcubacteria group bacterium Gr01-1014_17]|nr:MAG: ribonuclease HI [Parcubacteria group bacterium Gr01-1014_17]